jgi:hypothetical protein
LAHFAILFASLRLTHRTFNRRGRKGYAKNTKRNMEIMKTKSRNRIGLWSVLFLFFHVSNAISQSNFDINDPRNPHCPCHKYQKMADDEYKKLKEKEMRQYGLFIKKEPAKTSEFSGRSFSSEDKIKKKHDHAFIKWKRKKKGKFHPLFKRGSGITHWDIWKRISDPTACYHWK